MASILYCLAHGFYFSDFSSGYNQKIQKKFFFIDSSTNIIDNNPCLPFSHKKQKTKLKNKQTNEKRENNNLGENK